MKIATDQKLQGENKIIYNPRENNWSEIERFLNAE